VLRIDGTNPAPCPAFVRSLLAAREESGTRPARQRQNLHRILAGLEHLSTRESGRLCRMPETMMSTCRRVVPIVLRRGLPVNRRVGGLENCLEDRLPGSSAAVFLALANRALHSLRSLSSTTARPEILALAPARCSSSRHRGTSLMPFAARRRGQARSRCCRSSARSGRLAVDPSRT